MGLTMHWTAASIVCVLINLFQVARFESMDELIVNAANSTREFEFFYDQPNHLVKIEYDMVFAEDEWQAILRYNASSSRTKRTAGIIPGRGGQRWTNNRINYQYAPGTFSSRDRSNIQQAMADWSRYTCLTFRQSSSGNRIRFSNGGGCYSRVGMVGGAQVVGLAPGCRVKGVVIHEIGHALGLHHEQTRPDRDNYVRIIRNNIPSHIYYNFQKYTWNVIQNMRIPYDYESIMHYGKTAFSTNGRLTIQTIDQSKQDVIGNRHSLSFRDIKSINIMYNCKRATSGCTKLDSSCPGEGFVGRDCQCWCPGNPYTRCSGTGTGGRTTQRPVTRATTRRPTTRPTTGCRDRHTACSTWARRGECRRNPSYMLSYCKVSCRVCGTTGRSCEDLHQSCAYWSRQGFCRTGYVNFMRTNCKSSCGLCSGSRSDVSCTDSDNNCPEWARIGECQRNPDFMLYGCRHSCDTCHLMASDTGSSTCRNTNQYCQPWANSGQCYSNAPYMHRECRLACGLCTA